ncbi:MAG: tripartite tricarboxylate transporter permease [Proteobacteria bacterium]|nr:tripartite tricarboxylate transporter permease [Pseudomonadota bacterium]
MLVPGLYENRLYIKVVSVPEEIMYPLILTIVLKSSFAIGSSFFVVASYSERSNPSILPITIIVRNNICEDSFTKFFVSTPNK